MCLYFACNALLSQPDYIDIARCPESCCPSSWLLQHWVAMVIIADDHGGKLIISGDTWDIKGILKNHGGVWQPTLKGWSFQKREEHGVMEALRHERLLVEDRRSLTGSIKAQSREQRGRSSTSLRVIEGPAVDITPPAPARARARSRTPPDIRLNGRTVQARTSALVTAARGAESIDLHAPDESRACSLAAELQAAVAEAEASVDISKAELAAQRALIVLDMADSLSAEALEASGLVRQATRLMFSRRCKTTQHCEALKQAARKAHGRWVKRRVEAVVVAERLGNLSV
eukprot:TRINITY_DN50968_c0_g1_i1.p1 TRINITY_DN50968_c0_g1~~TRINITY_DN50968_c0_g1_i1.p1  ORF type:complete len:288 (+),score=54.84 TRINITY_DN50968_c0_g1_i1:143-1006(+)